MIRVPRFFKCISKTDCLTVSVSAFFTKGKVYQESLVDLFGQEVEYSDEENYEGSLLLCSDYVTEDGYAVPLFVGCIDFELVPAPLLLCLN